MDSFAITQKNKFELIFKCNELYIFSLTIFYGTLLLFFFKKKELFFQSRKYRTGDRYGRKVSPKVTLIDNKTQINLKPNL